MYPMGNDSWTTNIIPVIELWYNDQEGFLTYNLQDESLGRFVL